jgi:hypothetical protein
VQLPLTGRSGPLVVEIEYRVAQDSARAFHNVMQDVQLSRQRNGAYGWSIARDIADPELWTERYHCPTWLDYLRQRNRATQSERALHQRPVSHALGIGCCNGRGNCVGAILVWQRVDAMGRANTVNEPLREHGAKPRLQRTAAVVIREQRLTLAVTFSNPRRLPRLLARSGQTIQLGVERIRDLARAAGSIEGIGGPIQHRSMLPHEMIPRSLIPRRAAT